MPRSYILVDTQLWRDPDWCELSWAEQHGVIQLAMIPHGQTQPASVEAIEATGLTTELMYACIKRDWIDYPSGGFILSPRALEWIRPVGPPLRPGVRAHIPAAVRRMVYERDGNACKWCLTTDNLSIDHIYPWSLGGSDDESNLQTLCRSCNSRKHTRLEEEWAG